MEGGEEERGLHAGEFLLVSAVKGAGEVKGRAQNLFRFLTGLYFYLQQMRHLLPRNADKHGLL